MGTTKRSSDDILTERATIGIFVGDLNPYSNLIWKGIAEKAKESGFNTLAFIGRDITNTAPDKYTNNIIYQLATEQVVNGLIILSAGISSLISAQEMRAFCEQFLPLPMVSVGEKIEGIPSLVVDNQKGLQDLIEHLILVHQRQRIAFVRGQETNVEAQERYQAYVETLAKHGLTVDEQLLIPGGYTYEMGQAAANELLRRGVDFDAVVSIDDGSAWGVMNTLQENGLHIPSDISVTGFDDTASSQFTMPPLSTVKQPLYQLGNEAFQMLMALLNAEKPEDAVLPTRMVVRQSCGCYSQAVQRVQRLEQAFSEAVPTVSRSEAFTLLQQDILQQLAEDPILTEPWLKEITMQLLATFYQALKDGDASILFREFDIILHQAARLNRDLYLIHDTLSMLRAGFRKYSAALGITPQLMENFWQQARISLSEISQQAQAQSSLKTELQNRLLFEISDDVITSFDFPKLAQALQGALKNLGAHTCFLCLKDNTDLAGHASALPEWSHLFLAIRDGEPFELDEAETRFPTRQLLPEGILHPNSHYDLLVMPLRFQDHYFGYAIFEMGQYDRNVYDLLQIQISSAIHGAHLVQQLNQAQANLELRVEERTSELKKEIADRKRAEKGLRENEQRYRALFDQTTDAIFIINLDGVHLAVNPRASELLGYTDAEMIGMSVDNVISPAEFDDGMQKLGQLLAGESLPVYERQFIRKDGGTLPVEISLSLVRDDSGDPLHIQSVVRDITHRKRAERVLQALNMASLAMRQAQTPKQIFETMGEEFKTLGFGCTIFRVNHDLSEIYPQYYNYDNAAVQTASKLLKVDAQKFAIKIQDVEIFQKTVWDQETIFVTDASEPVFQLLPKGLKKVSQTLIRLLGVPRSINAPLVIDAQLVGILSVQSNDLTEDDIPTITAFAHQIAASWQKAHLLQDLEMSLVEQLRVEESLRESEEKYRTLFEFSPEAIILLDLRGIILDVNQAAAKIGEKTRKEIIGKSFLGLGFFDENQAESYLKLFSSAINGDLIEPVEVDIWVDNQEKRWLEIHPAFLKRENTLLALQLIVRDVTERRIAEQSIQQRMAELEAIYQTSLQLSNASLRVREVAEIAVKQLSNVMQLDACSFSIYNPSGRTLSVMANLQLENKRNTLNKQWKIFQIEDYPITEQVLQTLTPVIVQASNPEVDPAELAYMQASNSATVVLIPLAVKGEAVGILRLENRVERHFTTAQLNLSITLANQIAVALDNARLFEAAQQELLERLQAEIALQESEEQFRSIFENAVMGLYRSTPSGKIVMANPALIRMLGYSSYEELSELNLRSDGFAEHHPRAKFKTIIEKEGQVIGLEAAWIRRDGSTLYVQENARAIYDSLGNIIYYEGTVEDISTRKKAEQDRQALIEFQRIVTNLSARFINLSVDEIDDEIFHALQIVSKYTQADASSVWLFSDDHATASKWYGWPDNTRIGSNQGIIIKQYPWMFSRLLNNESVVVSRLDEVPTEATDMLSLMNNFGMAAIFAVPLVSEGKSLGSLSIQMHNDKSSWVAEIDFLMKIIGDIIVNALERKRAEESIRKLNEELELRVVQRTQQLAAANTELEAFAYSVSHDLRAPLRAIDGFSLALMEDYGSQLDDTATDYLHRVRGASQRMGQLIDDLLKLSRVTRSEMSHQKVDLSKLVLETIAELQELEPQRKAEFDIQAGLTTQGDEHLLRIMIVNLISNAWKFTAKNPHTKIEFGCLPNEEHPVFFVRDNGAGFEMAYADKLFGTFQRLHSSHEFEGTGIGLATVKRIILRHGGRVWAEGQVDHGATFYFTIGE